MCTLMPFRCPHALAPCLLAALLAWTGAAAAQATPEASWQDVSGILLTPPVDAAGYVRFNFPRTDLAVQVGDVSIPASFALTGWVGFDGTPDSALAMGDLVVTAAELGPVLAELGRQSVEVTAVHNHLAGEEPQVTYVHFHQAGPPVRTARALDAALRLTGSPRPVRSVAPAAVTIDTAMVFRVLGARGRAAGAMAQVGPVLVPAPVRMHGLAIRPALAYASPINVLQLSAGRAVATGDFAVTAGQLSPLLAALAVHGLTATAVHHHLVGEEPKLYFVHFWGDAPLPMLLDALRAGLDATGPR